MWRELWDWIKTFAIAIVLVVLVRMFLFDNYVVFGQSMEPNFHQSERLIVNKIIYDFRLPHRGEVVVLRAPTGEDWIKRVIALPGDRVRIAGDDLYINGEKVEETYIADRIAERRAAGRTYNSIDFPADGGEVTVPEGKVFVMGDNRPYSRDSRDSSVGFIDINDIVGRAELVYWPLKKIQLVR